MERLFDLAGFAGCLVVVVACGSVSAGVDAASVDAENVDAPVPPDAELSDAAVPVSMQHMVYASDRSGSSNIHLSRLDGTGDMQVTLGAVASLFPTVSGDGSRIAFTQVGEIFAINPDGTGLTQLTNVAGSDFRPTFSLDGTKIAWVSDRNGSRNIYMMNADGSNQVRVTNTPDETTFPQFSPDGTKITFTNFSDLDIYVIGVDGTGQVNLTNSTSDDTTSSYSRDGTKIVFSSNRDGQIELYWMNADGSSPTRITNQPQASNQDEFHASFDLSGENVIYFAGSPRMIFLSPIDGSSTTRISPATSGAEKTGSWIF